jgi:PAS domain S-box-containing protein
MSASPIHVLLVEQDLGYSNQLQNHLESSLPEALSVHPVSNLEDALDYLGNGNPVEVLLIDPALPDNPGAEVLFKLHAKAPSTAVVVLGDIKNDDQAIEFIRQGAQEYVDRSEGLGTSLPRIIRLAWERGQRETGLREYGQRYKHLLDATTDYLYSVQLRNGHSVVTHHSPNCVKLTGYEMSEFEADSQLWFRMIYEPDRSAVLAQLAKVLNGDPTPPLEHRIMHKHAGIRWIRNTFVLHHNAQGRLVSYDGLITDITEAKLAAIQLAKAEKRYHDLVNHLNVGVYRNTPGEGGRFLEANPALIAMFEAESKEELMRHQVSDFYVDPAQRKRFSDKITSQGFVKDEELELKTLRGNRFWFSVSAIMIKLEDNQVFFDGVIQNITDRKAAQEALRRERILLRTVLDNLPDVIYAKDTEGHKILSNRVFLQFMGCKTEAEALGKTDLECYGSQAASGFFADDQTVMQTGQPVIDREHFFVHADGRPRWLLTSKLPLHDETGKLTGLVGIGHDITERKRAIEDLRKAYSELARSESALKHALEELQASHQQLQAAQLQLIQAAKMESIGTLAAGVAHEVKNPLQTVLMGLAYIQNNLPQAQDELQQTVQDMFEAVKRADVIIRELLQLSVASQLAMQWENLNDLIERSLWLLHYEVGAGKFKIVKQLSADLPRVHADKNKMEQVFVNLFLNALQAMAQGGSLMIKTRSQRWNQAQVGDPPQGGQISISDQVVIMEIQDTGPGVAESNLARIFDPFFTTKQVGEGTGLGLSVVKQIMDMHGGVIQVGNVPEGGFRVTLILKAEPQGNV